jgi:hypothetical protein
MEINVKGLLFIIAILLFALVAFVFLGNGASFGGSSSSEINTDLSCRNETNSLTGIKGIGISHSMNITVQLKDASGRVVIPSDRDHQETESGISFDALLYFEGRVTNGNYTAEVMEGGNVIITYPLRLTDADSPVLTVVCE